MNDEKADKIIELLEQIKSLQQQGVDNYRNAIRNQEESIALQKSATSKFRNVLLPIILLVLILAVVVIFFMLKMLWRYR